MRRQFQTPFGDRLLGIASELLNGAKDERSMAEAVAAYHAAAEREAEEKGGSRVACGPGCPHCCVLNVSVLLSEAASIAIRLSDDLPADELAGLVKRLHDQRLRVRWMENGERIRLGIGCPFLDAAGSCAVHPYRPIVCRGFTSFDLASCNAALDPCDPDAPEFIAMDLRRKVIMEDAYLAMADAMGKSGMETRCIELSAGVFTFLTEPHLCRLLLSGGRFPSSAWD